MTHNDFIVLVDKNTRNQALWYLPVDQRDDKKTILEQLYEEFGEDSINNTTLEEVPFEGWDLDTLAEYLGDLMEDVNWHSRADWEPRMFAEALTQPEIDESARRSVYRAIIRGFESRINR